MLEFVREHASALVYSVLVHLLIVAGLVLSVGRFTQPAAAPMKVVPVVQSSVVDMTEINKQIRDDRERQIAARQEQERKASEARRAREEEQVRQVILKKKREQEERQAKLTAQAELKKQAELQVKRKAEEKAAREKAEQEKQRLAEKKRKEEEARRKADELRKKQQAEERRRKAAEAKQKAEAEAQLREQIAGEERRMAAEKSGLLAQYVALIGQKIERNWIRPPSAKPGLECVLQVSQIPGGQVVSVRIVRCNGDDAVVRSVEAAVYQASPLPDPPDPSLFERKLQLVFKPED